MADEAAGKGALTGQVALPVEELWSEADEEWGKELDVGLLPIAKRHGAKMFKLVWQSGMANEALQHVVMVANGLKPSIHHRGMAQDLGKAASMLATSMNALAQSKLEDMGKNMGHFNECKQDIERLMALRQGGMSEGQVSPSGIILQS